MALPSHRRTSSDKRRRSAHFALKKVALTTCPNCKKPIRPHYACSNCGEYRGHSTLDTDRNATRTIKKQTKTKAPAVNEVEAKAAKTEQKVSQKKASKN